jgi:hypothetical protein
VVHRDDASCICYVLDLSLIDTALELDTGKHVERDATREVLTYMLDSAIHGWCSVQDSNPRPHVLETAALTTELTEHLLFGTLIYPISYLLALIFGYRITARRHGSSIPDAPSDAIFIPLGVLVLCPVPVPRVMASDAAVLEYGLNIFEGDVVRSVQHNREQEF